MFFLRSLVFTLFSPSFYKEAVKRGGKGAFGVYFLFILLITVLAWVGFIFTTGLNLLSPDADFIEDFPSITVQDGILDVEDAEVPLEYTEGGQYFGIDDTGVLFEIPEGYSSGFLLTQTEVIIRDDSAYGDQVVTYDDLLTNFDMDSFEIDSSRVEGIFQTLGVVLIIAFPFAAFIWFFITKLLVAFVISVLGLIVMSIMNQKDAFTKSWLIAMYAAIPATYVGFVWSMFNKLTLSLFDFTLGTLCCLIPLLVALFKWGVFWGIGAMGVRE